MRLHFHKITLRSETGCSTEQRIESTHVNTALQNTPMVIANPPKRKASVDLRNGKAPQLGTSKRQDQSATRGGPHLGDLCVPLIRERVWANVGETKKRGVSIHFYSNQVAECDVRTALHVGPSFPTVSPDIRTVKLCHTAAGYQTTPSRSQFGITGVNSVLHHHFSVPDLQVRCECASPCLVH